MALTLRNELHRIAKTWITVSALNAGAYLVTGFTVGSDQKQDNQVLVPWQIPTAASFIVKRSNYDQLITGRRAGQGFLTAQWTLSLLTFSMETVLYALYDDPDQSSEVTIKHYDQRNIVRYLQCFAQPFNEWFDGATPIQGGYQNVTILFSGGVEIT